MPTAPHDDDDEEVVVIKRVELVHQDVFLYDVRPLETLIGSDLVVPGIYGCFVEGESYTPALESRLIGMQKLRGMHRRSSPSTEQIACHLALQSCPDIGTKRDIGTPGSRKGLRRPRGVACVERADHQECASSIVRRVLSPHSRLTCDHMVSAPRGAFQTTFASRSPSRAINASSPGRAPILRRPTPSWTSRGSFLRICATWYAPTLDRLHP